MLEAGACLGLVCVGLSWSDAFNKTIKTFNMKIIEWAMRHRQLILLIVAIAMIFGAYSLVVMPKQEFPVFTIRQGVVVAVYPGASSGQVEEQIAKTLEGYVFSYEEVDKESPCPE